MRNFLIVAGETSGDAHAADLIREASKLEPDVRFTGLGGQRMADAGARILFDPTRVSSTGVTEVLSSIPRLFPYLSRLAAWCRAERPDAAILVDWPEFNMRLARRLHRAGTRVIYYISPQLWAWREWRVREIRANVDAMLVLFRFEVDFYRRHGVHARFVGHPLVDRLADVRRDPGFKAALGVPDGHRVIGLLPGSRRREVRHIGPALVGAARLLLARDPDLAFVWGKAPHIPDDLVDRIRGDLPMHVMDNGAHRVMVNADLLLVASGTATLEAAVLGTPMVVAYKATPLTYHLCKPLKKTKYMAMINVLADRPIVPELLQYEMTPARLAAEAANLMKEDRLEATRKELLDAAAMLGPPGASRRAAAEVLKIAPAGESDK